MNDWEDKCWGKTRCISLTATYSQHDLCLEPAGSFCSLHYHENRSNIFAVTRGVVRVVWLMGWEVRYCTLTEKSMSLMIRANVIHQFQVLEEGFMIETYQCDGKSIISVDDIHRLSVGGTTNIDLQKEVAILLPNGDKWLPAKPILPLF